MWEFFWFFLGAFFYKFLAFVLSVANKGQFVNDIKFLAIQLLGQAAMELATVRTLRNKMFKKNESMTKEDLKRIELEDEDFFRKWKKSAVKKLNESVPPLYKPYVNVEDWEEISQLLIDCHNYSVAGGKEKVNK